MKINKLEYRVATLVSPNEGENFIVKGYATTFEPYELYKIDGITYYEKIDRRAFEGADMTDVVMQYDHQGKVLARQSNNTLILSTDDHGFLVEADLSKSTGSKELYNEIQSGLVTKMSWGFTVKEDTYDRETRTRTILKVDRVYDVSAVSIPANQDTEINVRSFLKNVEGTEKRIQKIKLKLKLEGIQ